jgi:hypothetical protein
VLHSVRSWGPREVVREQPFSVIHEFDSWRKSRELAEAVAAIKALTAVIERSEASTMMGLEVELKTASDALKVKPACECSCIPFPQQLFCRHECTILVLILMGLRKLCRDLCGNMGHGDCNESQKLQRFLGFRDFLCVDSNVEWMPV